MKPEKKLDYRAFQAKIMLRFFENALISVFLVIGFYLILWKQRGGNLVVNFMVRIMRIDADTAYYLYDAIFRDHKELFFAAAIIFTFTLLLWNVFRWIKQYFGEINQGIDILLKDDSERIHLSAEMGPFEQKLNTVKETLEKRKEESELAEQRKNDLVMYLAHDIRTPLTSVIGYLNLLEENPEMPMEQRAKYVQITLKKAERLEKMINEFFEITRYNSQKIKLVKVPIDLYYMLTQLIDEMSPSLLAHGNEVVLQADENLTVCADADKLARVFSNILKNAAAYSYADTEIKITAEKKDEQIVVSFQNKGKTIPAEKLSVLFERFFRLDESRISDTGGTGLGLAIAKEVVILHGGTIRAESENETVTFWVVLPA